MDFKRKSILDLNEDCQLKIIKHIIADCEMRDKWQGNKVKYADLVNFALAHQNFETILEDYFKDLYESLKFVFVANRDELEIDFSELETTFTGKIRDAFWRTYVDAIRQNKVLDRVVLEYAAESFQPNFLDHFEIIKRALENKNKLKDVRICLKGYSLEDLNNFDHILYLDLDVRVSAEALVKVCKSNPDLKYLSFQSTEILGRLSDIAPYCHNLTKLEFAAKADIDGVEYAPLAELPNLRDITIYRASENGSLVTIFEAIQKWQRPALQPLEITFSELFPHLRNVNIARMNSILCLSLYHYLKGIKLWTSYNFWDISRDSSPLNHSLATFTLIEASLSIDYEGLTIIKCPKSDTDISGFISILKIFNIKTLKLKVINDEIPLAKLFESIISDESFALKSINTGSTKIDQFVISKLVKIKSITSLTCTFSDWESVELLSALTNLETVDVDVERKFKMSSSKALCSLINICSASGGIKCRNWYIGFRKIESITSQRKRITALTISVKGKSHIFEAFSYRDLITIEELDVSKCVRINIKDILKMSEVHPIKKLRISLASKNDIEHLSDLAELEELTIHDSVKGSLIKLFDQMAMKASPSLQYLKINSKDLSSEELVRALTIMSLKKLDLSDSQPEAFGSLTGLKSSNIEELILPRSYCPLGNLFLLKTTTRPKLEMTEIPNIYRLTYELEDRYETGLNSLKSLKWQCHMYNEVFFLAKIKHLVNLDIAFTKEPGRLRCLAELEKLESLTLRLDKSTFLDNYDILANIQNLKKLDLSAGIYDNVNLTNVYRAFVNKNVKLTHLTTSIVCVKELNEITQIKTLRKLHLFIKSMDTKITFLGELSELKSLEIIGKHDDFMLPILKCCRNLDRLLINSSDYLRGIYTHLKSIRDSAVQGPLTVILTNLHAIYTENNNNKNTDIPVVLFENVYLKVFTSSKGYYSF